MSKKICITGGGGFIGAHLVKKLVNMGHRVVVLDSLVRGSNSRLSEVVNEIEIQNIDIRDESKVIQYTKGCDLIIHLAAVNGTENFYNHPELVLDVGIRSMLSIVNACRKNNIYDLIVASSAEVYQTPSKIPTDESIALYLPDSINPRYSYGGSKIASELIAFNYGIEHFNKLQIFRPHNVYGPDMGWKHVIPQFIERAIKVSNSSNNDFPIQGTGVETRAFCYVDDIIDGIIKMYEKGSHREIYHIGNDDEISIKTLIEMIGEELKVDLNIVTSPIQEGGTLRRCPNINKMKEIGYQPKYPLTKGLKITTDWYLQNIDSKPKNHLM